MPISAIVAVARNGVIGRDNALPWHLPKDLQHFKALTLNKPILMGRKTYQSIGRPLPQRHNIILTRDTSYQADGCTIVHSLTQVLEPYVKKDELFIIGGADIYAAAWPFIKTIYLTQIHADVVGDTYFPALDFSVFKEVSRVYHPQDELHEYDFSFVTLERL